MQDLDLNEPMPEIDELEPLPLGAVSELTGSGGPGEGDADNIVWGNF